MAMTLRSDKEGWEKQSRNRVIKPKRCNNSNCIDGLTDELLVEILQRVPCKSAFRCKSVSKRWLALISDPYFTHSFIRYYHTNENRELQPREFVLNFFFKGFVVISEFPEFGFPLCLNFLPCFQTSQLQEEFCVAGSSNGLLLCCTTMNYQSVYYVCNPLTKHWVVLPPAPTFPERVLVGFIYDPGDYCNSTSSKCSFKVVRLSTLHGEGSAFKVETFSSKTSQWTNSIVSCPRGSVNEFIGRKSGIEFNGKLHWYCVIRQVILVYHPNDDKVTFIDCPKLTPIHGEILKHVKNLDMLGVSRGCLRMSQLHISLSSVKTAGLSIWELKDYNTGKWCLDRQVDIIDLIRKNKSPRPNWEPKPPCVLAFHPYGDGMFLGFYEKLPRVHHRSYTLLVLPPWPTPVPALPHDALLQ